MTEIIFKDMRITCLTCGFTWIELANASPIGGPLPRGYVFKKSNEEEHHLKTTGHKTFDHSFNLDVGEEKK